MLYETFAKKLRQYEGRRARKRESERKRKREKERERKSVVRSNHWINMSIFDSGNYLCLIIRCRRGDSQPVKVIN